MIITNLEKAQAIAEKVKCLVFSISPKDAEAEKLGIESAVAILPDADLINAVSKGDIKIKKAVKKHVKRVMKMRAGDDCVNMMNLLATIAHKNKSKKTPLIVLVSNEEGPVGDFIKAAVAEAFRKAYGFKMITGKELKKSKALKGKKKNRKEAVAKMALKATTFSSKGQKFHRTARLLYFPENLYSETFMNVDPAAMMDRIKKMQLKGKNKAGKKNDNLLILQDIVKNDKKVAKAYDKLRKNKELLEAVGVKLKKGKDMKKNKVTAWMFFLCHIVADRKGFTAANAKEYREVFQQYLAKFDKANGGDSHDAFKKAISEMNK